MVMNLDEGQRKKVADWVSQGLKLSEIQNRLASELGLRLTYMEVRMLVDDLKLVPKDVEPVKPGSPLTAAAPAPAPPGQAAQEPPEPKDPGAPASRVSVSVDHLARPGAVVSGKVTFTDGNRAEWYFDQTGQLKVLSSQPGYRPPPADLQEFQTALESELSRMGF
jgi:hypothetical protein